MWEIVIVYRRGVGLQEFRDHVCDITSALSHADAIGVAEHPYLYFANAGRERN